MPLGAQVSFENFELNETKFLRDTERVINKVIKEAAREFLLEVLRVVQGAPHTSGDNFPVQTGEAKGSLLPLAAALAQAQLGVSIPITPAAKRPNKIAEGRSQGNVSLGRSDASLNYEFTYSSDVLHFLINDISGSDIPKSKTPWRTMELGLVAFERYIDANLFERMPRLNEYLFVSQVGNL